MKTQSPRRRRLLAGVLAVGLAGGLAQGCAESGALVKPTSAEPLPAEQRVETHAVPAATPEPTSEPTQAVKEEGLVPPASALVEAAPVPPVAAATTVTAIDVQRRDDGLVVVVTGDGELSFQAMRLAGNRLVLDLPGVVNGTKRHTIAVGHPLMRQIRMGRQQLPQPTLRLVLDLEGAVPYMIDKRGAQLSVMLSGRVPLPGTQDVSAPPRSAPVATDRPAGERSRRNVIIPAPARLTLLDPLPALAQSKSGDSLESGRVGGGEQFSGRRISLDFQDAEISSVLRLIADVSGLNMVVGESVKAKVTIKLLNVPWDQGLDLILKLNNLGQIREGNILWIDTLANITKLRDDAVKAQDATLKAEDLVTKILYLNYADAAKSVDVAKSNLSTRGEIKVDSRTNSLVVRDVAGSLAKVEQIVRDLDQRTPQVQIEARIVQATKDFSRGLGVKWGIGGISGQHPQGPITANLGSGNGAFGSPGNDFLVNLPSAIAAGTGGGVFGLLIGKFLGTTGTLDLRLSAGESLGLSKIVSSPKIITLDNKSAKIEQGTQIPFQTSSANLGTTTTFVDATLTLNVTPHIILHANTVRLEIKATKNAPGAPVEGSTLPSISKREATTEILLRDGETTVLGGIFEETKSDTTAGIPWFNRIPFLGWLFKNESIVVNQTELLIFVTPTILKD